MGSKMTASPPLVVDLDGTLLKSDMLIECGMSLIRTNPLQTWKIFCWLLYGKIRLKENLSASTSVDVSVLPYDQKVLGFLNNEKKQGRTLILATASHHTIAESVASHLGIFDHVLATSKDVNLSAGNKRNALIAEYGEKQFDYMGNSKDDLPVWEAARKAILVNPEGGVEQRARCQSDVDHIINTKKALCKSWPRALRFHQWTKNLLIFVPLLASHKILEIDLFINGILAFLCFGLCASSVYLLNDLLDLEDDRHHSTKCHRPFASGDLSLLHGLMVTPVLLAISFTLSVWLLPLPFTLTMATYYGLTLAYSLVLKRLMMVDVVTLASLYTLRIIAGTFVFGVMLTFWMLAFSMFIFLSLALVKRYAELRQAREKDKTAKARGRGYYPDDLEMVSALGAASGYLSVLVLALYIQDDSTLTLYSTPELIWLACPVLLYWISRIWMITHRGAMHDDPVIFAVKDPISLFAGILFGLSFWVAI